MKTCLFTLMTLTLISGCVSNKAVQTIQPGDDRKSCEVLVSELGKLGAKFENTKDDSGVTGKNVGLAILFWPGIIVNEVRANKNQDSINKRISHLNTIYAKNCSGKIQSNTNKGSLKEKLLELKDLHAQGLITDEEYETGRRKAVDNM